MSTPRSKFFQRMIKEKPSENVEDRRPEPGVAPEGSAGYYGAYKSPLGGNVMPDLEQPLNLSHDPTVVDETDMRIDRGAARMARMEQYKPTRKRGLNRIRLGGK